jgi:quinol monooxygenase YgiN
MIRSVLSMTVREGDTEEFVRVWRPFADQVAEQPGSLGQTLAVDATQPRRFVINSDWQTAEALRAFETGPVRQALSAALEPLRESASKSVLDVIVQI